VKVLKINQDEIDAKHWSVTALETSTGRYALPKELNRDHYRRICPEESLHRHVLQIISDRANRGKCITIHLCDDPTICAFRDGILVDTSSGYSVAGGLPGFHTSGMIDPSIPIMLRMAGLTSSEIANILLSECGYQSIHPSSRSILEIISKDDSSNNLARKIFVSSLLKEIGACMASLTGIDALIFFSEEEQYNAFTLGLCNELSWIGLDLLGQIEQKNHLYQLTKMTSPINGLFVHI